ncbi:hypothetical protein AGABI1DRAFT_93144 [Agaricus bisporus var. burnettii JB137-S8]|uniref:Uncharacterized protein n=1 Tax=Agaricus bisporus var. burnettii (strain JB137-S8 / ATCC MYA-4627 / FGSC 10392) TaxID=597362 RepID=K5VTL3_AGABU|nr:uncharacterized protein AGABI1DRAFT_93144 [Agaricus bisporus var. burnettii JB137-S8]EKM77809.1 hypothetical protein AGABI1DRAFT_93144 [Agaricus bisporus var. burnettii JB137-S8]
MSSVTRTRSYRDIYAFCILVILFRLERYTSEPHRLFLKNLNPHFSEDEWLNDNVSGAFIPLRWFEYTRKDETNPNDPEYNASIFQERETDKAQLQMLLKFFQKKGAPLDKDKVNYGCMVDIHPHDEWTADHSAHVSLRYLAFIRLYTIARLDP